MSQENIQLQPPRPEHLGPEFVTPEPNRLQRLALTGARMLLKAQSSTELLETLATDVGGFKAEVNPFSGQTEYKAEVERKITMSRWDETADSRPLSGFKSGADHEAATGTNLATAAGQTLKGIRHSGERATTFRARTARRLTHFATNKGTSVNDLLKK